MFDRAGASVPAAQPGGEWAALLGGWALLVLLKLFPSLWTLGHLRAYWWVTAGTAKLRHRIVRLRAMLRRLLPDSDWPARQLAKALTTIQGLDRNKRRMWGSTLTTSILIKAPSCNPCPPYQARSHQRTQSLAVSSPASKLAACTGTRRQMQFHQGRSFDHGPLLEPRHVDSSRNTTDIQRYSG